MRPLLALSLVALLAACAARPIPVETNACPEDAAFEAKLLEAGARYASWHKVDDLAHWAPALCSAPPMPRARLSTSADGDTHGKKLYFLYAKDRAAYVKHGEGQGPVAVGQTIVKESFVPEPGVDGAPAKPGKRAALFVMMKLDPKTEGSDEGWVYATLAPDGKKVTSSGKLESCMGCHVKAKRDRLFGKAE